MDLWQGSSLKEAIEKKSDTQWVKCLKLLKDQTFQPL